MNNWKEMLLLVFTNPITALYILNEDDYTLDHMPSFPPISEEDD